ncbi:serine/threonine-protein kinase [Mycobacterium sp. 050134]|uniref:serine/threonine-protein kinase n=1 Tax=Mycobacterium sp. 050134 TaxID=3096111 RepID=UPI002EDA6E72
MSLEVGEVFAGYAVLRTLGAGGMGRVYLVAHPRLPREDALKVLPVNLGADPEFRARFLREAELAARLSHPHIVGIHDRGECEGHLWISMDYVAGTDAGRLLREDHTGGMPPGEVVPIITAVASALDYAHQRGLLHRDVKPANILLTDPDGQARRIFLADFGLARQIDDPVGLTATDMTVGTVAYVSPEQLKGEPVDGRADQYALACTAFHLLTGTQPYSGSNPAVVIGQHIGASPPSIGARRPDLAVLDPVFAIAMAKDPSYRFATCGQFADRLARQLGFGAPQHDTDAALTAQALPSATGRRRRRHGFVIGAVAAVALLGGTSAVVHFSRRHAAEPGGGAPVTAATPAANTGPFTGVYRAEFGRATNLDDVPVPGAGPSSGTYAVRSVCRPGGCVATAARLSGEFKLASTSVFDQVGGRWVAVSLAADKCRDARAEMWEVFSLQPRPDGTLIGDYRGAAANACDQKRTVTFTRTGDVDVNSLPDPAALPPRVASPAESLRGRYHVTRNFQQGMPQQQLDLAVVTDCLRGGDRCMSYFHSKTIDEPLVFGGGAWALDIEHNENASACGGTVFVKATGRYPLPEPAQDPIATLTGHNLLEQAGQPACTMRVRYDETLRRTGD